MTPEMLRHLGLAIVGAAIQFAIATAFWRWGWQATAFSVAFAFGAILMLAPKK